MGINIRRKKLGVFVLTFYFFIQFIQTIEITDFFALGMTLEKIKYAYLVLVVLYFVFTFKGIIPKKVVILTGLLLLHTIIFGKILVNKSVLELTNMHFREMMIYIGIVFFTFYLVWNEQMWIQFVRGNYYIMCAVMFLCILFHFSDLGNPINFIYVFSAHHGFRSTFGFSHGNFTGNLLLFSLIYSFLLLRELLNQHKKIGERKEIFIILVCDCILIEMLFSTESRTSIIGLILFFSVILFFYVRRRIHISVYAKLILIFACMIIILFLNISGIFENVWLASNRDANITVNLEFFKKYSPWTGMGYLPSYCFLSKAWGLETFAVDIYYVYIFFTTGYLGCMIIGGMLVLTVFFLKHCNSNKCIDCIWALLWSMLFAGLGQAHMISYSLTSSRTNWILVFLALAPVNEILKEKFL